MYKHVLNFWQWLKDMNNEHFIRYHSRKFIQYSGVDMNLSSIHLACMTSHIKQRSPQQVKRMERKLGLM